MARKNHRWLPVVNAATRTIQCLHCELLQTHGWYLGDDDQVLDVISRATPAGTVLGIRPTFSLGAPPANRLNETIDTG